MGKVTIRGGVVFIPRDAKIADMAFLKVQIVLDTAAELDVPSAQAWINERTQGCEFSGCMICTADDYAEHVARGSMTRMIGAGDAN